MDQSGQNGFNMIEVDRIGSSALNITKVNQIGILNIYHCYCIFRDYISNF